MAQAKATFVIKAVDKTKAAFQSVEKSTSKLAASFAKLGAAASLAVAGALTKFTKDAAKSADEIGKFSRQLGISTEALSEYKFVAQQTGVEFRQFAIAMQRVGRRVAEAAVGTGEAQAAIKELGFDAAALSRLPLDEQFEAISEALRNTVGSSNQLRLAFKLFDSEGVRLLRTVKEDASAIRDLRDEAKRLGVSFDEDLTETAEDTIDAFGRLGSAAEGVGAQMLEISSPTVIGGLGFVEDVLVGIKNQLKSINDEGTPGIFDFLFGGTELTGQAKLDSLFADLAARTDALNAKLFEQAQAGLESSAAYQQTLRDIKLVNREAEHLVAAQKSFNEFSLKESIQEIDTSGFIQRRADLSELAAPDERRTPDIDLVPVPDFAIDAARQYAQVLEDIKTPFENYTDEVERLNALTDTTGITTEELNRALVQAGEGYRDAQLAAEGLSDALDAEEFEAIADVAGDTARGIANAFIDSNASIADSFKQLATRVIAQLFEILVVQQLVDAASGAVSGFFKPTAQGGPVAGGQPLLVGERGPELFVPQGNGNVVPNNELGGGVNINFTVNSLDPRTAASVIAENKQVIIGVVSQGFQRAGNSIGIA